MVDRNDTTEPPVLIRVANLSKAFGATQALRDASFELRAGEVHALVGENGSGKSTLVKILSGVHAPDTGTIELSGTTVSALDSPRHAQDRGIVTVFQEVLVAGACTVEQNVWLGVEGPLRARVARGDRRRLAGEAIEEILSRPLDLDAAIEELSLSDRQACCIVRALLRKPKVLILDEATSALDVATRDRLFAVVRRLRGDGLGVVVITHRMDEIDEIGERVTVLRTGETVATLSDRRWSTAELVRLMTGSEELVEQPQRATSRAASFGATLVSVRGLQLRPDSQPFDARIQAGELIGVAGLEGHGQHEFLNALRGAGAFAGDIVHHGDDDEEAVVRSTADAAARGIAYVPRDRKDSTFPWMSVRENFGMPTLQEDARSGWLLPSSTKRRLTAYRDQLNIVLGQTDDRITTLSGGNQQKVVIARWLATAPRVLLLHDPTRGIDIGAKRDLYALLINLANDGLAVVMLSTEVDEHVELMDRVLVFRDHELHRDIPGDELTRQTLVSAFFGQPAEPQMETT